MATWTPPEPNWITVWDEGRRTLARDPVFGPWVRAIGPVRIVDLSESGEPFAHLARTICYQQLAGKAAAAIHGRFVETLSGEVTADRVLATPDEPLRAAGLSRNKLAAIRDLATRVRAGEVELRDLEEQPDDEVVRRLTRVRGIGPWTARMYLMFRLRRPDVWPVGDLGVRQGFARAHGRDEVPSARELEPLGEGYRPWRSAAAFYCWRILETELP